MISKLYYSIENMSIIKKFECVVYYVSIVCSENTSKKLSFKTSTIFLKKLKVFQNKKLMIYMFDIEAYKVILKKALL